MRQIGLLMFILLFLPFLVKAEVIINEVAWMGTEQAATDEWMELYNNSSADIDLNGWLFEAQDGSPLINLTGIISARGFFLLERSDDDSVLEIVADLIYTGALSNAGEILILRDASGAAVDRIDASAGWQVIRGNNKIKKT